MGGVTKSKGSVSQLITMAAITAAAALLPASSARAAIINAGDLMVSQVGDGVTTLAGTAFPVSVVEYAPATPNQIVAVNTIPLPNAAVAPTSGNRNLLIAGAANTEGIVKRSQDGRFLVLAGYNTTTTASGGPNSTVATATNRVVGLIDQNGAVDTTTALNDAMSGQNVRTAYSTNGTDLWIAGNGGGNVTINAVTVATSGVRYTTRGSSNVANTATTSVGLNQSGLTGNFRSLNSFNNQLYVSSNSTSGTGAPARGIDSVGVGSGFPTAPPQINTNIPGSPADTTRSCADFWFKDANTLYIADTRPFTTGNVTTSGGIQRWNFNSGTNVWDFGYTLGVGNNVSLAGTGFAGAVGLTGFWDGNVLSAPLLYATTFDTNSGTGTGGVAQTNLVTITDTGAGSAVTVLATSPVNTAFRGVDFAPVPEPTGVATLLGAAGLAAARRRRRA